jgi:hypothetical protein
MLWLSISKIVRTCGVVEDSSRRNRTRQCFGLGWTIDETQGEKEAWREGIVAQRRRLQKMGRKREKSWKQSPGVRERRESEKLELWWEGSFAVPDLRVHEDSFIG